MKLKICGMREPGNIAGIAGLNPDYMGFIFYEKSKRYVGEHFSEETLLKLPATIKKVGVFVNQSPEVVAAQVRAYGLDMVQLHGDESPAEVEKVQLLLPDMPIVKAFGVDEEFDFSMVNGYKSYCDFFLFDTRVAGYGGSGKAFSWDVLKKYDNEIPFFLSGGIGVEELKGLGEVASTYNIHAIDVNSKAEISPGLKDPEIVTSIKNTLDKLPCRKI